VNPSRWTRKWAALAIVLALVLIGVLVAWFSQRDAVKSPPDVAAAKVPAPAQALPAPAASSFDFYLMALTVHPAFCADGHTRKRECQVRSHRPLVIHGLWPERNEPKSYPRDCPAAPLDLDSALALELQDFMPGVADNLDEHEWRTHGGCSGLDDDEYFRHALELARGVDAALSAKLTTLAGRETTAAELRYVVNAFRPGLASSLTFHCRTLRDAPEAHSREPYLIEVRQCVDNDGPRGAPRTVLDCATVKRRDQGCGRAFRIAEAG
jgi:ribonuclease I